MTVLDFAVPLLLGRLVRVFVWRFTHLTHDRLTLAHWPLQWEVLAVKSGVYT